MTPSARRWQIDFHAHTNFSYDCALRPRSVIELARKRGLDGIAITDHDTEEGGLAALEANPYADFLVIPGIEVKTDLGDLIGLYITHPIKTRRFFDVAEEIRSQGGFTYVPHPVRTFKKLVEFYPTFPHADAWEIFNGRYSPEEMHLAREFFPDAGRPAGLSGSDSHFPWDIGICRSLLPVRPDSPDALRSALSDAVSIVHPRTEFARKMAIYLGAMVKARKRGNYGWLAREIASIPWKAVRVCAKTLLGRE